MKKQLPNNGAAAKPTPPVIKVAIFSDSARDQSVVEDARRSLQAAGYKLVAMLFGLKEIDDYLFGLKRQDADCPDIALVDLYSMDDSNPSLYLRNIAADRYFGKLVPAGLAEAIRSINACIRVAICSEASPEDDPFVNIFYQGGLVATGRRNPCGPVIFFPKVEWSKESVRFLRREGRVAQVTVGTEPLRKWKKSLHARPLLSRLITAAYPWIPFKRWWAGDRRWVYEIDEYGHPIVPAKRHLLRTTVLVADYAAVVTELIRLGTFSKRFYNQDLATVAAQAARGGRKIRVLHADDTAHHRGKYARKNLKNCEVIECTSASETMAFLSKLRNRKTPREEWPDVVLCDLYMPGYVDRNGTLRPLNDRERTSAPLLPLGFAIALVARSMGLRVAICTDLRHHHNDRIVSMLGNLDTLGSVMIGGRGGVIVFEADYFSVEERWVPGVGIVKTTTTSIFDKPEHWQGKLLRWQGRRPKWLRNLFGWPDPDESITPCFDPETGRYITTVPSKRVYAIKDLGVVLDKLIESPIIHPDLRNLDRAVLAQFGIKT